MAMTKIQMQRMQMRMKLPLFVKTVNDLKPLKAVIAKRSTLSIWWGSEHASSSAELYI